MKKFKKYLPLIIVFVFIIVAFVFFSKGIAGGMSIKGNDGNYSSQKVLQTWFKHGGMTRWDSVGLGQKGGNLLSMYVPMMKILPLNIALSVSYFVSMILGFTFMFLFLKKLKLKDLAATVGAIAWAFAPHFLSPVFGGHMTVVEMPAIIAMVMYFSTLVFSFDIKSWQRWASLVPAGVGWGILFSQEPQRALYLSVMIAFYLLTLIIKESGFKWKEWKQTLTDKQFYMRVLKILVLGGILFATAFHSLKGWLSFAHVGSSDAVTQTVEKTAAQKWGFSTSWSLHPSELVENFAWGYFGKESYNQQFPYWGKLEYMSSSQALGFFVIILMILGVALNTHLRKIKLFSKEISIPRIENPLIRVFFWLGMISLLLSMGKFFPGIPFFWLYLQIPFMDKFRIAVKFIAVTSFAWVVVAAYGMQALQDLVGQEDSAQKIKNIWIGSLILVGIGVIWLVWVNLTHSSMVAGLRVMPTLGSVKAANLAIDGINRSLGRMILLSVLFAGVLTALRYKSKIKVLKPGFLWIMVPMILIEMWTISNFYLQKSYFNAKEYFNGDQIVNSLSQEQGQFRNSLGLMVPNRGRVATIPATSMYQDYKAFQFLYHDLELTELNGSSRADSVSSLFFAQMLNSSTKPGGIQNAEDLIDLNLHLFRMTGTKYLLTDGYLYTGQQPMVIYYTLLSNAAFELKGSAKSKNSRDHFVFEVKDSLPRLALYTGVISVSNPAQGLAMIADPDFDYRSYMVLQGEQPATNTAVGELVAVKELEHKPWLVRAEVDSKVSAYLLHNISYSPAWKVTIDNQPAQLEKANYLFQAVKVPAGKHKVEFRFEPEQKWARLAGYLIWLAMLVVLVLAGFGIRSFMRKEQIE